MPRSLSRLRFRTPRPQRINLNRIPVDNRLALERAARRHVVVESKPATPLSLHFVTDPKWKEQPGKKPRKLSYKPHTLRDLVDPQKATKHGQIIYIFKNTRTKQVIYSLAELLGNHHLEQLPFMGKHSKPPTIRPDEWTPHCIVTFPTPHQGLHAFRKLRELRKLHELSWDKTNPEWIKLSAKRRMEKIMNQVAFATADLAAILKRQEQQAGWMQTRLEEQEQQAVDFMARKWPEINALAEASLKKDKRDGDNTKWLEHQIKRMDYQLGMKTNQDEKNQRRLKTAKRSHEVRLRKILYAQRKSEQFRIAQNALEAKAAPAKEPGAAEQLERLRQELGLAEAEVDNPTSERTAEGAQFDKDMARDYKKKISQLEIAFEAKQKAEAYDHLVARSILPPHLKKELPKPFTMDVEIKWADLLDAEYALKKWPAPVLHDILPLKATRESVEFLSAEEYEMAVQSEASGVVNELEKKALREAGLLEEEEAPEPVEEKKGIAKFIPTLKIPFKRAEV
ncbi:hypothetical protein K458DRAFT_476646 [Lentithecium fluviatile CBS 122367]|uniref:Large ribosomal subunit protein mL67 n=1 Tax=Lentithecium fluviatile CBS 122367 TaxID=1168545 RepID=A0A6G1JA35_9PLEO|nr:hypothetical protein K458DRAFT_476646 [Lentithecium fluviatile CBS 122367]